MFYTPRHATLGEVAAGIGCRRLLAVTSGATVPTMTSAATTLLVLKTMISRMRLSPGSAETGSVAWLTDGPARVGA